MGSGFRSDPSVERWYTMRETTHLYFRPTPKSIAFGLVTLVAVPLALWVALDHGNPVVVYHGMGDFADSPGMLRFCKEIGEGLGEGAFVQAVQVGDSSSQDKNLSIFDNVNRQIEEVCNSLKAVPELASGFNAIVLSQGGQFLRAYVERCNDPPVHTLITLGAQHQGVMALPGCPTSSEECGWWNRLMKLGVFNPLIHHKVVQAQYYKNPKELEKYLRINDFLTDINNELQIKKQTYKKNLSNLQKFVMYMFEKDSMVVPRESSWFGYFNGTNLLSLREQAIYLEDWIGLRSLDEAGRLEFRLISDSDHLRLPADFIQKEIIPLLMG